MDVYIVMRQDFTEDDLLVRDEVMFGTAYLCKAQKAQENLEAEGDVNYRYYCCANGSRAADAG